MCNIDVSSNMYRTHKGMLFKSNPKSLLSTENSQTQMVTTSDQSLLNGGMMVQTGAMAPMGPTTVMGQIMGALNTGLAEDLNIESLEHGFDCNVDEVSEFL